MKEQFDSIAGAQDAETATAPRLAGSNDVSSSADGVPQVRSRPTIVHLAVEYNTPQRVKTTTAVEWFVEALDDTFDNVMIAYRRRPRPSHGQECRFEGDVRRAYDFPFFGLPLGVGLKSAMRTAAMRTIRLLEREGIRPDLVHAHKLTFEGIAGWYVARHFGVPLVVSLRGEVETRVFRMKPELRGFLRRICQDSALIYHVSAWFRDEYHTYVRGTEARERLLPNIVRNIHPVIEPRPAGDAFVSVFNFNMWKRKGLTWMLDGFARAAARNPSLRLDIVGGGSDKSEAKVKAEIAKRNLQSRVRLRGKVPNAQLLTELPNYRGLLLPSVNETFGMVYVEALFAGVPVIFTAGSAIDGYLDGLDVARTVPPRDVPAIADAILEVDALTDSLRENIRQAAPTLFARFDPETALAGYRADIEAVLAPQE